MKKTETPPTSSHRGIWKFPSDRVSPFRSPLDWLEGKKKDDNIGNLWRVHDKLYDLTEFVSRHPGGSEWLSMTRGLDITEAFESSHIVNVSKVEATLSKYYQAEAKTPRYSPYTFKEDGFYKSLKRAAEPILKEVGTDSTRKVKLMQDGLILGFLTLSALGTWYNSFVVKVLAGMVLTMAANAAHNFVHMRANLRRYYMDFSFLSSYEWKASHVLSHHNYPNTVLDAEMSLNEPHFAFMPSGEKSWFQRYGPLLYCHPMWAIIHHVPFTKKWVSILRGKIDLHPQDFIVFAEILFLIPFASSLSDALWSWLIIHTASSYYFGLFSFTVAHHHPSIWHDGDEARPEPDFGLCQLDAVRERTDAIYDNLFFVMTRYGDHALHHMFPTVCHSKLPHLRAVLEKTLTEFQEQVLAFPEWELFLGTFKQLQRTEPRPFQYLNGSKKAD